MILVKTGGVHIVPGVAADPGQSASISCPPPPGPPLPPGHTPPPGSGGGAGGYCVPVYLQLPDYTSIVIGFHCQ